VPKGEELEVVESLGDWIKVYLDDEIVYVFAEFVQVDAKLSTAVTMTELLYGQGVSDVRVDLCQYAKQFLGNPYVWGGTSLTNGADCSGFVLSVYKKYGVSLPHYSGSQANCGTKISLSEAKPGDLVFYGSGQTINHVAIYIGNGQVIHASNPKTGIKISNVYYKTPLKTVRILQD
ncbi:MAG: C40 family peptidase, partial [Butyrivibrio sp.]|nr:C40 family peptidase [Butyrivibrio sp.]